MDCIVEKLAVLNTPDDLKVTAHAHGINRVTFEGKNGGDVQYEVWRRHDDTVPWGLQATIRLESYTDTHVLGGQQYQYKVRATSEESVSEFSTVALVCGKT